MADPAQRVRRLRWQCRRGMLELELLLQGFLEERFERSPVDVQDAFEVLLAEPDPVLLDWLLGQSVPEAPELADVVRRIRRRAPA
jgi:antitoxin CptB